MAVRKIKLKTMFCLTKTIVHGDKRFLSTQAMSGADMIKSCHDYTMWSWSAQKQVDPIAMTRAEVCMRTIYQHPYVETRKK